MRLKIDEMAAGPDLDVLIAQEVMGWQRGHETRLMTSDDKPGDRNYFEPYPTYDVFLQPPGDSGRVYLYSTHNLDIARDVSEWFVLDGLLPEWSTDENASGLLQDYVAERHVSFRVIVFWGSHDGQRVNAACCISWLGVANATATASTRPLAVCLAVLKAARREWDK